MNTHTPGPWTIVTKAASNYAGNFEIAEALEEHHEANARLVGVTPELLTTAMAVLACSDDLFRLATDSIVHDGDGTWRCKSCGMELDSGSDHSDTCCASAILDLAVPLHNLEAVIRKATH